mgnify:CR=1 FL=1
MLLLKRRLVAFIRLLGSRFESQKVFHFRVFIDKGKKPLDRASIDVAVGKDWRHVKGQVEGELNEYAML